MIVNRMILGLSAALAFAAVGCGGDDPLTGSWTNTACYGSATTPAGIKSCSTELTFTADLAFSLQAKEFSEPATASDPGCTTTSHVDGQTWSTDGTTLTLGGTGKATTERSSCVKDSDEFKAYSTKDIEVPAGAWEYVVTGHTTLTIAKGPLAGTYRR